jgi:cellulose synthase operon protein C
MWHLDRSRCGSVKALALYLVLAVSHAAAQGSDVVSQLIAQAQAFQAKGRMDQAAEAYQKVLRSQPENIEALEALGVWHAKAGRTDQARSLLATLEKVAPGSPAAGRLKAALSVGKDFDGLLARARDEVKAGRLAAAVPLYEQAFGGAAPPPNVALEYYQTLGGTEAGWTRARDGLASFSAANPNNAAAKLALAQHLTYREPSRRDGIDQLRTLAKDKAARASVLPSWRSALVWLQPSAADARYYQAYLDEVGPDAELQTRLTSLTSATATVDRGSNVQAGFAALDRKDTSEATRQFERAGESPDALVGLGLIAMRNEDFELAVKLLERASQRAPKHPELWEKPLLSARFWDLVRRAEKLTAAKEYAAAESMLRNAVALSREESHHARLALGRLLAASGRVALAEQELRALRGERADDADVLRALVDLQLSRGDLAGAIDSNAQLASLAPDQAYPAADLSAEMLRRRAVELRARGQGEEAHKLLLEAAKQAPKQYWVIHDLASLELELGLFDSARARLADLQELDPKQPATRVLSARFEGESGRPDVGLEILTGLPPDAAGGQVGRLHKELTLRRDVERVVRKGSRLGKFSMRRELLKLQRDAGSDPNLIAIVALGFADAGDADRAVELLTQAIASQSTPDAGLSLQLAAVYLRTDRQAELRELLEELAVDPALSARSRRDLGRLHVAYAVRNADQLAVGGEYNRALALLEPLIGEYPDEPSLLCGLGRLFIATHDYPEARATFEKVLAHDPNNLEAREGAVTVAQLRGDRETARKLVDEGLSRTPNRARMHLVAARVELADQDDAAAIRELRRARDLAEQGESAATSAPAADGDMVPSESGGLLRRARAKLHSVQALGAAERERLVSEVDKEIDRIDARHSITLTGEPWLRYRAGEQGFGRLLELQLPLGISVPLGYFGRVEFGVSAVTLNAGRALLDQTDTALRFGSLGSVLGTTSQRKQDDSGFAPHAAIAYRDLLRLQVGATPLGFLFQSLIGSLTLQGQWGRFNAKLHGEREAVTDSVLSYAGTTDPRSGQTYGGVTAQGGGVELGWGDNKAYVFVGGAVHALSGHNVDDNLRATAMASAHFTLYDDEQQRVKLGVSAYGAHFDKNLSGFTYGHGGYFSPEWFVRGGIPLEWRMLSEALETRIVVDPGMNWFRREAELYYPASANLQRDLRAVSDVTRYAGGDVWGFSLNVDGDLRYRITPAFSLGLAGGMHFAKDYEQYTASLILELNLGRKAKQSPVVTEVSR